MRKTTPKKYAISLYESLKDAEKDKITGILKSFIFLLVKNKQLAKADKIIEAFKRYANEQEGLLELSLFSAEKLDACLKDQIIEYLEQSLNKKIEAKDYTDKNLIGGIVLKYGDKVIDGSVKRRIELLAKTLK